MEASESLSCENNNISLFSALPESSNMYSNKDSNLISEIGLANSVDPVVDPVELAGFVGLVSFVDRVDFVGLAGSADSLNIVG